MSRNVISTAPHRGASVARTPSGTTSLSHIFIQPLTIHSERQTVNRTGLEFGFYSHTEFTSTARPQGIRSTIRSSQRCIFAKIFKPQYHTKEPSGPCSCSTLFCFIDRVLAFLSLFLQPRDDSTFQLLHLRLLRISLAEVINKAISHKTYPSALVAYQIPWQPSFLLITFLFWLLQHPVLSPKRVNHQAHVRRITAEPSWMRVEIALGFYVCTS